MWWLLLLGVGGYAVYRTESAPSSLPGNTSGADATRAVAIALKIETDPTYLNEFAKTILAYNPTYSAELSARAATLKPIPLETAVSATKVSTSSSVLSHLAIPK